MSMGIHMLTNILKVVNCQVIPSGFSMKETAAQHATLRTGMYLIGDSVLNPLAQTKEALVRPDEDRALLLPLHISVHCRCHGGLGRFALHVDQAPPKCIPRNLACSDRKDIC